jgi:group I intron endonuclease
MAAPKDRNVKTYLYRITNLINGNDYVGITVDYKKRFRDHVRDARIGPKPDESLIAKAIRKYGEDNFKFEVISIARTWDIGAMLEKLARKLGMGKYNRTEGGEGVTGMRHSDESKAKMAAAKLGKPREITEEHRAKLVANGKARKGVQKTEEHRANMSKARRGYKLGPRPQEVKDKIAKTNTGKTHSPETRAKMKASALARHERERAEKAAQENLPQENK